MSLSASSSTSLLPSHCEDLAIPFSQAYAACGGSLAMYADDLVGNIACHVDDHMALPAPMIPIRLLL